MGNFKYEVNKPCLDYYCIETVEIKPNQFDILIIERRYGPSWWLMGYKYDWEKEKWNETQIEEIYNKDIARLIGWCKNNNIKFTARPLTKELDIIKPCYEIYKYYGEIMVERIIHNNQEIKDIQRRGNITKAEAQKIIAFYEPIRKKYYDEGIIKKARLVEHNLHYITYNISKSKHKYCGCDEYNEDIEDYTNKDIDDCLNYCERNYFGND